MKGVCKDHAKQKQNAITTKDKKGKILNAIKKLEKKTIKIQKKTQTINQSKSKIG